MLITFLAWDSTALDMYLESIWGEPSGFSLRDQWWMAKIMHEGAHNLGGGRASWAALNSAAIASAVVAAEPAGAGLAGVAAAVAVVGLDGPTPTWNVAAGLASCSLGSDLASAIATCAGVAPSLPRSKKKEALRLNTITAAASYGDYPLLRCPVTLLPRCATHFVGAAAALC